MKKAGFSEPNTQRVLSTLNFLLFLVICDHDASSHSLSAEGAINALIVPKAPEASAIRCIDKIPTLLQFHLILPFAFGIWKSADHCTAVVSPMSLHPRHYFQTCILKPL